MAQPTSPPVEAQSPPPLTSEPAGAAAGATAGASQTAAPVADASTGDKSAEPAATPEQPKTPENEAPREATGTQTTSPSEQQADAPKSSEAASRAAPDAAADVSHNKAQSEIEREGAPATVPNNNESAPERVQAAPAADPASTPQESANTQAATPPAATPSPDAAPPAPPPPPVLMVESGTGALAQAFDKTVFGPFGKRRSIMVAAAGSASDAPRDVVVLDRARLDAACEAGDLVTIETSELVPAATQNGTPDRDFLDGGLSSCGVGWLAWSTLFVFEPSRFTNRVPNRLADVMDLKRYPGKRALPADGLGLFEALLVADGVAAGDVYAKLQTSDGIRQAMRQLKRLGDSIVWYERHSEAIELIRSGKASLALTTNGHAFVEQARSGPLGQIWDGQVVHVDYLAVPKTAKLKEQAKAFVAFSTAPEQLAALVSEIPYGPMRRSAIEMAERHAVTGQPLSAFMPTSAPNQKSAVRFDPAWWSRNRGSISEAISIAKNGPPPPTRR